jgi:hypothetical protein
MALNILLLSLGLFMQNADTMTLPSQTLQVTIARNAQDTYAYLSDPHHMNEWAKGIGASITPTADKYTWQVQTPNGPAKVRFTEQNAFGVADHYVNDGKRPEVYIPLRVLANGSGSEVIFTLFRLSHMTDEDYQRDKAAVQKDLDKLKQVLESRR